MNKVMAEGIEVVSFVEIPEDKKQSGMTITAAADYRITLSESAKSAETIRRIPSLWKEKAANFLSQEKITVVKATKRSEKEVDIKPMIYDMQVGEKEIYLFLAAGS